MKLLIIKKIKTLITVLVLVELIFFCGSCSQNKMRTLSVSNLSLSECLSSSDSLSGTNLIFNYADGFLNINHVIILNCASLITDVRAYIVDNKIIIDYLTDNNISMNCLCEKEIQYALQEIPIGEYEIIVRIDSIEFYHQKHRLS